MRLVLASLLIACSPAVAPDAGTDAPEPDTFVAVDAPPDPCDGAVASVETVAMLSRGRYSPAVERLPDGRILIAGGFDFSLGMSGSAELYDPTTRTLTPTGSLAVGRNFASATAVDGGVLVAAGFDNVTGSVGSIERYDAASGTFTTMAGGLTVGREAHTATLLPDGRVLFAGGLQARGLRFIGAREIYDPATDTVTSAGGMTPPRGFHAAAWIESRRSVLLVGGDSGVGELSDALRYEIDTGTLVPLATGRAHATKAIEAVVLDDGRVLVVGGANATDGSLADVDVYDPATDAFAPAAPMSTRRMAYTLTALSDGRVVAIGGWSDSETSPDGTGPMATGSIEVRAADGSWSRLPMNLSVPRLDHRTVALDACHVVVIGGQYAATGEDNRAPREVELVTIPRM